MRVCVVLLVCALAAGVSVAAESETLQGKLVQREGLPPALDSGGKLVTLQGDKPTLAVVSDKRLNGVDMQAKGHFAAPGVFEIDPIHTRAILVRRDGKLKLVTYWCDICSIRTYSPGPCWCCQRETTLDLRDPDAQ